MKFSGVATVLTGLAAGHAARLYETPMAKVVTLLENMKAKIEKTGKSEQSSYDKYTCWCEDTMAEKGEAITKAKDKLEDLQNNIVKNKAGLGSGGATIKQLQKEIGENVESQKEATTVRDKENAEYTSERGEAEQCIGALEASIKVLTGAGGGKTKFLETLQEARLLSVVSGMRPVLQAQKVTHTMSKKDMEVVQHFVEKPSDFLKGGSLVALQNNQNPFGDYAPQSSQIQGILKSMYDTFTTDLEKSNGEEGEQQKVYEELMSTKKKELANLEKSLASETKSDADRSKSVAEDKEMRDTTQDQLKSDTAFFLSTKESCSAKATQWAQRSRLRTKEVAGISEAIKILSSDAAKKTFKGSDDAKFLQLSSAVDRPRVQGAFKKLRSLASHFKSLKMAQIAVAVKTSKGHFADVITMIDEMTADLREEEQDDIDHRDRCEGKQNDNKNSKEDSQNAIDKAADKIKALEGAIKTKEGEIKQLGKDIAAAEKTQGEIKKDRNDEKDVYKKALKDDQDAVALLDKAQASLEEFYRDTKAFLQVGAKPAPNTNFQDGDYKGSTGEARGVIGILEMLKEDINKQIKSEGQAEIDAQVAYEAQYTELTMANRASEKAKMQAEKEKADLGEDKNDQTGYKEEAEADVAEEETRAKAIEKDCNWVKTNFESRRDKRKAEMDGLTDAKEFLSQAGGPDDLDMP